MFNYNIIPFQLLTFEIFLSKLQRSRFKFARISGHEFKHFSKFFLPTTMLIENLENLEKATKKIDISWITAKKTFFFNPFNFLINRFSQIHSSIYSIFCHFYPKSFHDYKQSCHKDIFIPLTFLCQWHCHQARSFKSFIKAKSV